MSKSSSIVLGAISAAPLLGFIVIAVCAPSLAPGSALYPNNPHLLSQIGLAYIIGSWIIVIAAMAFALKSHRITQSQRLMWIVSLFLFNMVTLPVFWYKCIWSPAHEPAT